MAGSRISVRGELVEEAKHRGADGEAASAIWGPEDRVDLLQTSVSRADPQSCHERAPGNFVDSELGAWCAA